MIIFLSSIIFALIVLFIERSIGIGFDFHPDSLVYLKISGIVKFEDFFKNPVDLIGRFYYLIVGFFDKNKTILITINIIFFALTNFIIYSSIKNILCKKSNLYLIFSLLLIFDPYRAHLSVHILKDTLIEFSLIYSLIYINKYFGLVSVFYFFWEFF